MLEIVSRLLLLTGLMYFAWKDYHTYYIGMLEAAIIGILGVVLQFLWEGNIAVISEIFASMIIGICMIVIGVISKENIGIGDGVLFLVTGCYLHLWENIILFFRTIFLIGGFAFLCLLIRKLKKIERIPMAPFMLAAYVTTL